jgi:hypothetical protein
MRLVEGLFEQYVGKVEGRAVNLLGSAYESASGLNDSVHEGIEQTIKVGLGLGMLTLAVAHDSVDGIFGRAGWRVESLEQAMRLDNRTAARRAESP